MDGPGDEAIQAAIAGASPQDVARLRRALADVIRVHGPRPVTPWSQPRGAGTADSPLHVPYPRYSPEVEALMTALSDVGAQPAFDWMAWPGRRTIDSPEAVEQASLADVARVLTSIVRAERFGDGHLARALQQGVVVAAAARVAAAAGR